VDDNSAADGDTYTIDNVSFAKAGTGADIKSFGLPGQPATIAGTNITWTLPAGTNVTALAPTFSLSNGATCDPASASAQDFTNAVIYTVTPATGAAKVFTVTVNYQTVVDISGEININSVVGTANIGRLIGQTQTLWNSTSFTVPIILNGNTLKINSGGGNAMSGNGPISGNGVVRVEGAEYWGNNWNNYINLAGTVGNTYAGNTYVPAGTARLAKTSGDAMCGTVVVGATNDTGRVLWAGNDQIADDANVSLLYFNVGALYPGRDTYLDLAGFTDRINDLTMATGTYVKTGAGGVLKVKRLFVGGAEQPRGAYTLDSGFVQGSGYIDVDDYGPPVVLQPPATPVTPTPADLSNTVNPASFNNKLDWADSSGATSYDVYYWLATDSKPATPTANVGVSEYVIPGGVLSLTTYKWQVVAKNSVGTADGAEWTFTTVARWDITGTIDNPNNWVGIGNTANLIGNATFGWQTGNCAIPATLNQYTLSLNSGGGNYYNYTGQIISGTGGLNVQGVNYWSANWNNPIKIGGSAGNSYSGPTLVLPGTASLEKSSGNALCGAITVGSHTDTARVVWTADNQIADDSSIALLFFNVGTGEYAGRGSWLDLNGHSDTVASLTLETGTFVKTGTGGVLTVTSLAVSGTTMGPGTYTADTNPEFIQGTGSVVVPGASAFDTWAANQGLSGDDAAFGADPDHDGIPNGIEFVVGGDPNPAHAGANSCGLLPQGSINGDFFVFQYTIMHDAAYLNPVVQFDTDMQGAWTTAVDGENATILPTVGESSDLIEVRIPKNGNAAMFARLKVTSP
jgi:hypothetical protein